MRSLALQPSLAEFPRTANALNQGHHMVAQSLPPPLPRRGGVRDPVPVSGWGSETPSALGDCPGQDPPQRGPLEEGRPSATQARVATCHTVGHLSRLGSRASRKPKVPVVHTWAHADPPHQGPLPRGTEVLVVSHSGAAARSTEGTALGTDHSPHRHAGVSRSPRPPRWSGRQSNHASEGEPQSTWAHGPVPENQHWR